MDSSPYLFIYFAEYTIYVLVYLDRLQKLLTRALEEQTPIIGYSGKKERLLIFTLQFGQELFSRKF
jgi:hypothetical protein